LNWKKWLEKFDKYTTELLPHLEKVNLFLPTYIINLASRPERKLHIQQEFEGREEFDVTFVEAVAHENGRVGLWRSIVKIIKTARERGEDLILICEDDHCFTEAYHRDHFFRLLCDAAKNPIDLLSGGIGGFGHAMRVGTGRYWMDWFYCTQFIVVFESLFDKILSYDFQPTDTADGVLSVLAQHKETCFPFLSVQKDFGYSDVTTSNNEVKGLIERYFQHTHQRLAMMEQVYHQYHKTDGRP